MNITRLIIGIMGGYLVSSLLTITFSHTLPFSNQAEAVLLASILSYSVWALLIIYAFSSVTLKSLLMQFSLISLNLFFINSCLTSKAF